MASSYADGVGSAASFSNPTGICLSPYGDLIVTDKANNLIRKVSTFGKDWCTVLPSTLLELAHSWCVCVWWCVRLAGKVATMVGTAVNWVFQDGFGTNAGLSSPMGLACLPNGNVLVADYWSHKIRELIGLLLILFSLHSARPQA